MVSCDKNIVSRGFNCSSMIWLCSVDTRARARRRQCATMGVDRTPRDGGAEAAARYRQYEYKAVRVRVM